MIEKTNGGFLISQLKQIQGRAFQKLLKHSGIDEFNGAQGKILYVLWNTNNIPIVELSKQTGLAKTTLTSMLDRMENANLIVRTYNNLDRRQILISLTEKSNELKNAFTQVSIEMNKIFYAGFTDKEIMQFELMLEKIINNLKVSEKILCPLKLKMKYYQFGWTVKLYLFHL